MKIIASSIVLLLLNCLLCSPCSVVQLWKIIVIFQERDAYNDCIRKSKEANAGPDTYVHFTFDFSQNLSLPHYSRQIGPLYFLTLRKVKIFGVRVDSIPRQLNFLIDEDQTIGMDGKTSHRPDAVLSMLDWALQNCESDADTCSIHADNCPGMYILCKNVCMGMYNVCMCLCARGCLADIACARVFLQWII